MLKTIIGRLRSEKRGVSNVLVVMLSLILITVIVANVVLWNYQMNQLDIERMHESIKITEVSRLTRSAWSTAQNEFTVMKGSITSGSYAYTRAIDGSYETFTEGTETTQNHYYPSSYNLIGGTSLVSGSPQDLQTSNGAYMIFGSYAAGDENFVDQQSNVDGSADIGQHSNFDALKYGPDGSYDVLTEANTGMEYYLATRDTPLSTTSTTYVDYMSLTFTSINGAKYFVLAYIELTFSHTAYHQAWCQFVQDSTVLARYIDRPRVANTETMPQMFAYIYNGTGNSVTFKWQIATSNAAATTTAVRGRIYAIRLDNLNGAEYPNVYHSAEITDVNNVWGDGDKLDTFEITINPTSTAHYLIWASAKVESDSTSSSVSVRLVIDDTEYIPYLIGGESAWSYSRIEDTSTNEEHCFAIMAVRQFSPGMHSIKLQIADIDTTPSADWQYISLLAIKLTGVFTFFSASTVTQASTTSITLVDYTTLNIPSGNGGDYLVLGGIVTRGSSTSYDYETVLDIEGVVYGRQQIRPKDPNDYVPKVFMQNITLDNNAHTIKTRYRTLNSAMTVYVKNSDIVAIKLIPPNYELDLEVQWVNVDYNQENVHLCIYTGALDSENLRVDVWTETGWTTITSALSPNQWNNVSVSDYLTSSTFTIRFVDETKTGDTVQSSWQIDRVLLFTEENYVRVEFMGTSTTQDWIQIVWAADCSSTVGLVNITLQLYDYSADGYPTSGDGYITAIIGTEDVTLNQTITINPSRFRDANGNWKMKIVGKAATPFNLKIDLTELKITSPGVYRLEISNIFTIALSEYPLNCVYGLEIMVRYNVSETSERWFIKAYDWNSESFSDAGFNFTGGSQPVANEWNNYTVSINMNWTRYISDNGTVQIMFCDEGASGSQTFVCIDFIGVRVILNGIRLHIKNSGATTAHIVSLWIINVTHHMRYDADFFVNPGESATYIRVDVAPPQGDFIVKIVTERGNIDTF